MPDKLSPPDRPSSQRPPPDGAGLSGLLTLAILVVVVVGLDLAREVLIPITLSVLLSFLLAPLVHVLRMLRVGRIPAAILAVALALGLVLALAGVIGTQIAGLASRLPAYQQTIEHKVAVVRGFTIDQLSGFLPELGQHHPTGSAKPSTEASAAQSAPASIGLPSFSLVGLAQSVLVPIVSPLETTFIVFVVTIFILLQREDLRDRLIRLFGAGDLQRTTLALDEAGRRLSRYFIAQFSVNAGFGTVIGLGLTWIGVPSPLLWGTLGMLLRFVPYIGTPLAALLPVALAAAVSPGWQMALWTAGLYVVVESIVSQAVEPTLYGHTTGLSPFSVIVAAIFWTWLWGPIGLILSTPLTVCLLVLGRHVPRFAFLDVLLSDQPALTAEQSFYQRLLAGDPDEALDQSEQFLRAHPLAAYYDEVVMPGLRLAAQDAARGLLTPEQTERIGRSIGGMIRDLADHRDTKAVGGVAIGGEPDPAWTCDGAVLCVAGRGPLDEAAATVLAQLLRRSGLGVRVSPYAAVTRALIDALGVDEVQMACLVYLDLAGVPAHLRFLLRRLRQRLPTQPILVGFWRADDPVLSGEEERAGVDADLYVASLRAAVAACLRAASSAPPADLAGEGHPRPA